jgi:hypothetical protein
MVVVMRTVAATTLIIALIIAVLGFQKAQNKPEPSNLLVTHDQLPMYFERIELGKLARRWVVTTPGYTAEVVEWDKASGKRSAYLRHIGDATAGFGNLMSSVKGESLAGKTIEFTAMVRNLNSASAQLWMRVDRMNGRTGAFDNMDDRGIRVGGWEKAAIRLKIDKDAKAVMFGVMANTKGDILVDDIQLRIID